MNKKFEAIIFDLGNVLYDVDVQRSVKAFEKHGLKDFDRLYSLQEQSKLFDELETGKIGQKEFIERINKIVDSPLDADAIIESWNELLIGVPQENFEILLEIKEKYKTLLLSNTNAIHLEFINAYMKENFGVHSLSDLFDKAYYSFEVGLRKPGREIYDFVVQESNLDLETTLFIDDNEDNIKGAREAGLFSHHKTKHESLREIIKKYNLL
jgi:glucose-1-phosphatase